MFTSVSSRSASAYKRVGIETSVDNADPHKLVVLLFDALNQALGAARLAIQNGDVPAKCKHINHAVRIFEEGLIAPLNLQEGGDLAANLHSSVHLLCAASYYRQHQKRHQHHRRSSACDGARLQQLEANQREWPRLPATGLKRGVPSCHKC